MLLAAIMKTKNNLTLTPRRLANRAYVIIIATLKEIQTIDKVYCTNSGTTQLHLEPCSYYLQHWSHRSGWGAIHRMAAGGGILKGFRQAISGSLI